MNTVLQASATEPRQPLTQPDLSGQGFRKSEQGRARSRTRDEREPKLAGGVTGTDIEADEISNLDTIEKIDAALEELARHGVSLVSFNVMRQRITNLETENSKLRALFQERKDSEATGRSCVR